ncbi:Uncharacterised protein [uncultured archaeon]|nr:Uncharacterised protein [uncultured archaeon]
MNDEEYIEMETRKELYNKKKPVYALRGKDFIPFVGLRNYWKREKSELSVMNNLSNDYLNKCLITESILSMYNGAIIGGTGLLIAKGLVDLLSK